MSYRLIGTGTTNSQGIATCDYVGVGAGEIDIVASLDNATDISDSSIQSKIYGLMDCIKYDGGTSSNYNNTWKLTNVTINRGSEYTTITSSAQWGTAYLYNNPNTGSQLDLFETTDMVCIEFDAFGNHIQGKAGFNIRYYDGSQHYFGCSSGTGHHKVYVSHNRFAYYRDDVRIANYANQNIPNCYLQSVAEASGLEIKFANLKIYPVSSFPD